MKKTAENTAAIATAPFYVDYETLYGMGHTNMLRNLQRADNHGSFRVGERPLQFRESRTVAIYGGRQTGKTRFIFDQAGPTDVVILINSQNRKEFLERQPTSFRKLFAEDAGKVDPNNVVTLQTLIEDDEFEFTNADNIRRVFIDDALFAFERYKLRKIYKAVLNQLLKLDHFVLVG